MCVYIKTCGDLYDPNLASPSLSNSINSAKAWFRYICRNLPATVNGAWLCIRMNVSSTYVIAKPPCGLVGLINPYLCPGIDTAHVLHSLISLVFSVIPVQSISEDLKQQHTLYICTASGNNYPVISCHQANV